MEKSQSPDSTVLRFDGVSKRYRSVAALSDVSFQVAPGEIVAVIGANGAGKSTLMNIASGLKQADSGAVKVFGRDPLAQEVRRQRRVLPQELSFPVHVRVEEILNLILAHCESRDHQDLCDRLELTPLLSRLTSQLSGGERRKLGILCCLAGSPDLVLLDEPTANVDMLGQTRIQEILLEYFKGSKKSLVFSSHYVQEIELLADRAIVLLKGKVVADAPIRDLRGFTGLKKIKFKTKTRNLNLMTADHLKVSNDAVEAFGVDSDEMLRELIQKDPRAHGLEVSQPSLEEAILHIWSEGRSEAKLEGQPKERWGAC